MMNEITAIKEAINPNEILFVVDSMTGQDAVNTAKNLMIVLILTELFWQNLMEIPVVVPLCLYVRL